MFANGIVPVVDEYPSSNLFKPDRDTSYPSQVMVSQPVVVTSGNLGLPMPHLKGALVYTLSLDKTPTTYTTDLPSITDPYQILADGSVYDANKAVATYKITDVRFAPSKQVDARTQVLPEGIAIMLAKSGVSKLFRVTGADRSVNADQAKPLELSQPLPLFNLKRV